MISRRIVMVELLRTRDVSKAIMEDISIAKNLLLCGFVVLCGVCFMARLEGTLGEVCCYESVDAGSIPYQFSVVLERGRRRTIGSTPIAPIKSGQL